MNNEDMHLISKVRATLASPGWKEVMEPQMRERKNTMDKALRDPSLARKHRLPDDFVRGYLECFDWFLENYVRWAETSEVAYTEEVLAERRASMYDDVAKNGFGSPDGKMLTESDPI